MRAGQVPLLHTNQATTESYDLLNGSGGREWVGSARGGVKCICARSYYTVGMWVTPDRREHVKVAHDFCCASDIIVLNVGYPISLYMDYTVAYR